MAGQGRTRAGAGNRGRAGLCGTEQGTSDQSHHVMMI